MELDKELPICKVIKDFIENDDETQELVVNFYVKDGTFSEQNFKNFTNVFRSLDYKETIEKECLEATSENITMTISGIANIIQYCASNIYNKNKTKWQKKITATSESIEDLFDYDMDIAIKNNQNSTEIEEWETKKKSFKMTKEFKYTRKNVSYIACIYKTSNELFYSLKESKILKSIQIYGFKMTYTKGEKTKITENDILQYIVHGLQALTLSNKLLTKPQQNVILKDYHDLVKDHIEVRKYGDTEPSIPLITPKPITLERINMLDPEKYGAVSILSSYTVTEKADGERILLYVNSVGKAYLINNTYKIEDTGLTVSQAGYNSIIDGEYIMCNSRIDNVKKNLFAAFDIYFVGSKIITDFPLIGTKESDNSRYKSLLNFAKLVKENKDSIEFIVKKHRYSDNILKDSDDILSNKHQFPYEVDGLIFTPAKLALYSYYTNRTAQITDNVKWDRVFKWKPDDQNTIDFLVTFKQNNVKKNNENYKICNLYVAYNMSQNRDIDITLGLKLRYDNKFFQNDNKKRKAYIRSLFNPTDFYEYGVDNAAIKVNSRGEIRAENNDLIETESIVEFRYINDKTIPVNERWKAIRVREDKTRLLRSKRIQSTGSNGLSIVSKTANDHSVAQNIWRSIHNPVTDAMIRGKEPVFGSEAFDTSSGKLLESDDSYYSREIPRNHLFSGSMIFFHNHGVKKALYEMPQKRKTLLDLACGEGSDMGRWISSGYDFVFGIDFDRKGIYNPRSGIYNRMIAMKKKNYRTNKNEGINERLPDMAFAVGDCSLNIKNGDAASKMKIPDKDSERLMKMVLNPGRSNEIHLRNIVGKGANGFNAISCMFAVHYFFRSEETLDGFFKNVSDNIAKDGMFFCTFMNGDLVQQAIENNGGDLIEGRKNESENDKGVPVWAIIRRYDKGNESVYGKQIDVFIENTQKLITEYLVSTNLLIEKAQQFGLKLHKTERFEETFNKLKKEIPDSSSEYTKLHEEIINLDQDDILKKFSFFNQWMVFTRI
jgi:hypothetical protein